MATMNRKTMWAVLIIVVIGLVAFWYTKKEAPVPTPDTQLTSLGSYEYECDEHVGFVMTPAGDMGIVFTARGETVTLGVGDSAINCSPVQKPDEAPFNFGD